MTNQEILEKVISKVISNGYTFGFHEVNSFTVYPNLDIKIAVVAESKTAYCMTTLELDYYKLIFDIEFAKALWGKEEHLISDVIEDFCLRCKCSDCHLFGEDCWEYHLQQMVILSDSEKLKYLEKFL